MPPLRVLHCPENIGANAAQLAAAEREVGLASWCVSLHPHPFGYQPDEVLWPRPVGELRGRMDRMRLLWRALRRFDVVHFNFGQTILSPRPLPGTPRRLGIGAAFDSLLELRDAAWLRRAGKVVVVTFQGDDARQGDRSRQLFGITAASEVGPGYYTEETDREKRRRIGQFARLAHRIYALNPDLLHFLPPGARFLPYTSVDLREWTPVRRAPSTPPVVLHAPSHRGAKGTRYIVAAVERLRSEGVELDFRLVEGVSREEARRQYEGADLIVDQLLIGWYGGLAVECMALGKPVVCFIRDSDLHVIPDRMRRDIPVIRATPATIGSVLRESIAHPERLGAIGEAGRRYVERWHDPLSVARVTAADYAAIAARTPLLKGG